jgi:hypothetical protein
MAFSAAGGQGMYGNLYPLARPWSVCECLLRREVNL